MAQFEAFWNNPNYIFDSAKVEQIGSVARVRENFDSPYVLGNWAFENNVLDRSPRENHGTAIGSVSYVPGKIEQAIRTSGASYVDLGDIANYNSDDPFSVECWFKTTYAGGSAKALMGRQVSGGITLQGWLFFVDQFGRITFRLVANNNNNNKIQRAIAGIDWRDGLWHHVIARYNALPEGGPYPHDAISIIADNNFSPTYVDVPGAILTGNITNSVPAQIAAWQGTILWEGDIDEAVIYSNYLSDGQISCRYNAGTGRRRVFLFTDKPIIQINEAFTDPLLFAFTQFVETLGVGNDGGVVTYQISPNGTTWYYWSQIEENWVPNGANNYNTASVINDHISQFPAGPIWVRAFLITTDGCNEVELEKTVIGYSKGTAPIVDAGVNKGFEDHQYEAPFPDCDFYHPEYPSYDVVKAEYKIEGLVDNYVEIPQGGYSTLLEAVQAFMYLWDDPGIWTVWLRVTDNDPTGPNTAEDFLYVTVSKYFITFNVRDSETGVHLTNVNFSPGDGTPFEYYDSPIIHQYEWGSYNATFIKSPYTTQVIPVTITQDATINVFMSQILQRSDISEIVDRVWDEQREDHQLAGSTGQGLSIPLGRILHDDEGADRVQKLYDEADTLALKFRLRFDGVTPVERIPIAI
jgi:hypothetical protein